MGTAETPAAPSMGLKGSLESQLMILPKNTPPAVPTAKVARPKKRTIRVRP